jgi:RHS repeat-associated protein
VQRIVSGGVSTNYIYDGQDVVKDINSDGSTVEYLNGPGIDNKLRQTSSAGTVYFVQDHLGSTRALTDSSGNVVESINYDSFGQGASSLTRYGYTGREWDAEANLYYYRARWYDPQAGRFISEDPIGLEGGVNLYAYVGNNPTGYIDPSGNQRADARRFTQEELEWASGLRRQMESWPKPAQECGCSSGRTNPFLVAGGLALADGPEPGPSDVVALGYLAISFLAALAPPPALPICKDDGPGKVIPFPTPRSTPTLPPPPPPPGRKLGDEMCKLKEQQGMFCIYQCRDGATFSAYTNTGDKSGSCPPVAARPAGL